MRAGKGLKKPLPFFFFFGWAHALAIAHSKLIERAMDPDFRVPQAFLRLGRGYPGNQTRGGIVVWRLRVSESPGSSSRRPRTCEVDGGSCLRSNTRSCTVPPLRLPKASTFRSRRGSTHVPLENVPRHGTRGWKCHTLQKATQRSHRLCF